MTEHVFRQTYTEFRDPLYRFAYRLTSSQPVAEDLVHDCFLGLFRGGFDPARGGIRTYLYAAIRNLARKHYRDSGREFENSEPIAESALETMLNRETADAVRLAVESLPPLQREVLVLFEYEELPLAEISVIVDADLAAVKSRIFRARERLRKVLAPLREVA